MNILKQFDFNIGWIKQNWWLITAASTVYVYIIGFSSTLLFFNAFDVSVFPFFNITDYLRILFKDIALFTYPFFIILLVLAMSIVRKTEKDFSKQEGKKYSASLFLQSLSMRFETR